ncbi:TPA: Flp pilus assembly complex ATPase component TadA [Candidatus Woesearchaeota archaeon]|nr:Flp pilus assembly complex ATPase component TadA [Candidatus Woesearchaeota archaeon]HIH39220.1 Flp pilus assembly complex ATPase component TadA [Candidatus Woesearchaeota archaeon]
MADENSYEVLHEGEETILRVNAENWLTVPSLEDDPITMSRTMDMLIEVSQTARLIFSQKRDYEYDFNQTRMLAEVALIYNRLVKEKDIISFERLDVEHGDRYLNTKYAKLKNLLFTTMKSDPLACYVELTRMLREERTTLEKFKDPMAAPYQLKLINVLSYAIGLFDRTKMIILAKPYLPGYIVGTRDVYKKLFSPVIKPDFMYTKLMGTYPIDGEELDNYSIGQSEVTIFKIPDTIQYIYHLNPPEFNLSEEHYELLDLSRRIMAEHQPGKEEFTDPERMRQVFYSVGRDLLEELANFRNIRLSQDDLAELTQILVRYTIGFGLIEVLLSDEKIQDVTINSPMGHIPMFIVHADWGECKTNIIPTPAEAESWASKLRLISARPLDEANPILDTEIELPGARARVGVIAPPLNPSGLAYAFRRHRDKPWTLGLFVKNGMINALGAGLLSFLIDGNRTLLIAGTRSAGKTSLLGSVLTEISRRYRVITIEDSVTGDSEMIVRKNGEFIRTTIGKLVDEAIEKESILTTTGHEATINSENVEVFAMNKKGKITITKPSSFIRHKVSKPVFNIKTRSGRKLKVTGDHSLFMVGEDAEIAEAKVNELKIGDRIAVPKVLPLVNNVKERFSVLDRILDIENAFIRGENTNNALKEFSDEIYSFGISRNYSKHTIKGWEKRKVLPAKIVKDLIELRSAPDFAGDYFKIGENSVRMLPINVNLSNNFLTFLGLWIADGSYDKCSVIISCNDKEDREVVSNVAKEFGLEIKMHSDGVSYMINSKTLKLVMQDILGFTGDAYTKRIPKWIFGLGIEQISSILKGIFTGDGCVTNKEIGINLSSENLLKDMQTILLAFGIILRTGKRIKRDNTIRAAISSLDSIQKFSRYIGILQKYKSERLAKLCSKVSTHDTTDNFKLSLNTRNELSRILKEKFSRTDYITRENSLGRKKLASLIEGQTKSVLPDNLNILAKCDLLFDEISEISRIDNYNDYVYDLSVPGCESFVCENIVAHNTLELPGRALRELGYNIQQMKVASAMSKGTQEVSADEGIRTTLRLGDSALIVGEIRSLEAKALYEAMRVGALANVVAGTIHGDSPYGVFDRVVNDLEVPKTSFKATDIIVVCNPIRSPDGMHRWRRVTSITEIRKFWTEDPLVEHGFVDLMKYDAITDQLVPTDALINGESDILKGIAGSVKDWAGNWDAVWDNIELRARMKQALVDYSGKTHDSDLLEADFSVLANDEFHRISEIVKDETGVLDSKVIFFRWNEWMKTMIKKRGKI